jgi:hypothetical protein
MTGRRVTRCQFVTFYTKTACKKYKNLLEFPTLQWEILRSIEFCKDKDMQQEAKYVADELETLRAYSETVGEGVINGSLVSREKRVIPHHE